MEPPIHYVKTADGVTIACYAIGQGPALVWMSLPSHLQAERKLLPPLRRIYEGVSRIATLVRYDHRGFGLSERDISAFPLDALVGDLEAVVDRLGLTTFALWVDGWTTPVAISYAAAHPERVSHLVLSYPAFARVPPQLHQQVQAQMLSGSDWGFVSESIGRLIFGWEHEEVSREWAALYRGASTYDTFRAFWRDAGQWDVRDLLPSVVTPTLLVSSTYIPMAGPEQAWEIASLMPDARVAIADGAPGAERSAQAQAAIASFLLGPDAARFEAGTAAAAQSTAVILFADIVDSTRLTEKLGDTAFRERARELESRLRTVIAEAGGAAVGGRTLGDGVLATFSGARDAIEAALRCSSEGNSAGLPLHLGIHAGDVIREVNDVHGGAVNIAARISGLSAAGEVLVSDIVRGLGRTSAGVVFEDRGEQSLKGVSEPVRVYEVRPRAAGRRALPDGLTPREAEVLRLIAAGRSNLEISEELTLSVRTVARHIANIYTKIGTRNKAEATDYAHRHALT